MNNDDKTVDAKRYESKGRKLVKTTKTAISVEKQRKHIGKHVSSVIPRTDELKWMLRNSPYIADAAEGDKIQFISAIANSHQSHKQLALRALTQKIN